MISRGRVVKALMTNINDSMLKTREERIHVPCDLCGADTKELLFEKDTFRHVRCCQCGLVYVTPRLIDSVGQQESFYDSLANHSDDFDVVSSRDYSGGRKKRLLAEAASYKKYDRTGRILDIGCGFGGFLKAAFERGWKHPEGIEIAPQPASYVRRFFPVKTTPLEEDPYEENSFDVVRLNNVIEHLPSPKKLVTSVHDIVRLGGLFSISTTNFDSFSVAICGSKWQYIGGDNHLYLFTPRTLIQLLKDAGFRVILTKTRGINLTPKDYTNKPIPRFDRFLSRGIRKVEKGLDQFVRHTRKGHRLKIWAEKV
jgi:SAM-dependent methyltransferase